MQASEQPRLRRCSSGRKGSLSWRRASSAVSFRPLQAFVTRLERPRRARDPAKASVGRDGTTDTLVGQQRDYLFRELLAPREIKFAEVERLGLAIPPQGGVVSLGIRDLESAPSNSHSRTIYKVELRAPQAQLMITPGSAAARRARELTAGHEAVVGQSTQGAIIHHTVYISAEYIPCVWPSSRRMSLCPLSRCTSIRTHDRLQCELGMRRLVSTNRYSESGVVIKYDKIRGAYIANARPSGMNNPRVWIDNRCASLLIASHQAPPSVHGSDVCEALIQKLTTCLLTSLGGASQAGDRHLPRKENSRPDPARVRASGAAP